MMGHCKDCRYWSADVVKAEVADRPRLGRICKHPKYFLGYHHENVPQDGVQVENDEGWGFKTGPMFGCIHFNSDGKRKGHL